MGRSVRSGALEQDGHPLPPLTDNHHLLLRLCHEDRLQDGQVHQQTGGSQPHQQTGGSHSSISRQVGHTAPSADMWVTQPHPLKHLQHKRFKKSKVLHCNIFADFAFYQCNLLQLIHQHCGVTIPPFIVSL